MKAYIDTWLRGDSEQGLLTGRAGLPVTVAGAYAWWMEPDTDPQRDLNAGVDPERRQAAQQWARSALQRAREAFDPAARERTRLELGLPPRATQ